MCIRNDRRHNDQYHTKVEKFNTTMLDNVFIYYNWALIFN